MMLPYKWIFWAEILGNMIWTLVLGGEKMKPAGPVGVTSSFIKENNPNKIVYKYDWSLIK